MLYRGLNSIMSVQSKWQGTLENIGSLEVVHKELLAQRINKSLDGDLKIKSFSKSIRLVNVSFGYSRSGKCEISDVDLEIKAKAITAIIGQSGSGKSTLVDLISLLLTPARGEIYIDGILLNETTKHSKLIKNLRLPKHKPKLNERKIYPVYKKILIQKQ